MSVVFQDPPSRNVEKGNRKRYQIAGSSVLSLNESFLADTREMFFLAFLPVFNSLIGSVKANDTGNANSYNFLYDLYI